MRRVVYTVVLVLTLKFIALATSDSAFIANDQCKQSEVFLWQKNISISTDCDCPPNFIALISESGKPTFCIMLTKPQIWSNICISTGSTDDYYEITVNERATVNSFLRNANVTEFWISVRRESAFDPPQKQLPGSKWGAPLEFDEDYDLEVSNKATGNCLKANITRNYSAASFEDCSNLYPQLCVFKRDAMVRLHCSQDEYTTRYAYFQKYCYKIEKASSVRRQWNLYDVNSHRKFQLYQNLAKESSIRCESSIVQSNLTYHLQQAFLNGGQAHDELYYVAMRFDGIMTLTKDFDCVAYQFDNDAFKLPEIKLNFDRIHKKLLLVVSNGRFLWRERTKDTGFVCYTDADTELLKEVNIKRKVWPPQAQYGADEQEIYELKLYGDFPGYYWCEGHSVLNFTLIKSDRIVAQKKDSDIHIYSVLLEVYSLEYEKLWQKNNLKRLMKDYLQYLKSHDDEKIHRLTDLLKGMQVMKIEYIDQVFNRISLIVHVSARYTDYVVDLEPVVGGYAGKLYSSLANFCL